MSVLGNRFQFWLVSTEHLTDRIWFRDEDDFKMGMNLVAILACVIPVDVLAFILMSNHVHFVLCCCEAEAYAFIDEYKRRYARYVNRKYGTVELLRRNGRDVRPIDGNQESLEWAIAYVHMNCVAANICLSPTDYPWGTGGAFFKVRASKGRRLGQLSMRARQRILHTGLELPSNLLVDDSGYILPDSYVQVELVETLFRTPKRMLFFNQNSSKAKRRLSSDEDIPAFRDQVIASAIPDLCQSLFRKPNMGYLDENELTELLRQLRFRFSSNINQLGRISGLSYEKVAALLDKA